jgi:hypothetical protein
MSAILYGDFTWEGLQSEMAGVAARDGQIYKQMDTGSTYLHKAGVWEFISLGLSYIAPTKSARITTDESGYFHVDFVTPFIDDGYTVALTCQDNPFPVYVVSGFGSESVNGTYRWDGTSLENNKPIYILDGNSEQLLVFNGEFWELLQRIPPRRPGPGIESRLYINDSPDPEGDWSISDNGVLPIGELAPSDTEYKIPVAYKTNLDSTGFDIQTRDTRTGQSFGGIVVSWLATRNYNP